MRRLSALIQTPLSSKKQLLVATMLHQYSDDVWWFEKRDKKVLISIIQTYLHLCQSKETKPFVNTTIWDGDLLSDSNIKTILKTLDLRIPENVASHPDNHSIDNPSLPIQADSFRIQVYEYFCHSIGLIPLTIINPIVSKESPSYTIFDRQYPNHDNIQMIYDQAIQKLPDINTYWPEYEQILKQILSILITVWSNNQSNKQKSDLWERYKIQLPEKLGLLWLPYHGIQSLYPHKGIYDLQSEPKIIFYTETQALHTHLLSWLRSMSSDPTTQDWQWFFMKCRTIFPHLRPAHQRSHPDFLAYEASQRMEWEGKSVTKVCNKIKNTTTSNTQTPNGSQISHITTAWIDEIPKDLNKIPKEYTTILGSKEFPNSYFSNDQYLRLLVRIDQEYGLPPGTMAIFMMIESRGIPAQKSKAWAQGLFQCMPLTYSIYLPRLNTKWYRINTVTLGADQSSDPVVSALVAAEYLREYGFINGKYNYERAVVSYNAGTSRVWKSRSDLPHQTRVFVALYESLQNYINQVPWTYPKEVIKYWDAIKQSLIHPSNTLGPRSCTLETLIDPTTAIIWDSNAQAILNHINIKKEDRGILINAALSERTTSGIRTHELVSYAKTHITELKWINNVLVYVWVNDLMHPQLPQQEAKKTLIQIQELCNVIHTSYPHIQIFVSEYHIVLWIRAEFITHLNALLRAWKSPENILVIKASWVLYPGQYSHTDSPTNQVHPAPQNISILIKNLPIK